MTQDKSEGPPPPWPRLIEDFTQDTSFHGWRYLHPGTQYLFRRFLWFLVVGFCTGTFAWVVYGRIDKYSRFDKNVNVEVESSDSINFPTLTLCNQNMFRLTKAHEAGVLDLLEFHFKKDIQSRTMSGSKGFANISVTHGYQLSHPTASQYTFKDVSVSVCSSTCCSPYFESECKAYQFDFTTKTCYISMFNASTSGVNITKNENATYYEVTTCGKIPYTSEMRPISRADHDVSLYDFSIAASHKKEDMIQGCTFEGSPCSSDNFTMTLTDFGVCYTFNGLADEVIDTRKTGSSSGLRVVFTIEKDEYLSGPHHDVGMKLFLHEPNELAMVRDLGVAVDVGKHSYISVKATSLTNQKPPVGKCGSQKLRFYDQYSWFKCLRECETNKTIQLVGCRNIYMAPRATDVPGYCNIDNYTLNILNEEIKSVTAPCKCIEPCHRILYDSSIASIGLKATSLANTLSTGVHDFKAKTRAVKNLKFRVDGEYFEGIAGSILNVINGYNHFLNSTETLTANFLQQVQPTRALARKLYTDIFDKDLNNVLFGGLKEGQYVINTLFSPLKTSLSSLLEQIRIQCNILTMLLWQTATIRSTDTDAKLLAKASEVTQLVNDVTFGMMAFPSVAYNVSLVANYFKWNVTQYSFFPDAIIKGNSCIITFDSYANLSNKMKIDIQGIANLVNGSSGNALDEAETQNAFGNILRSMSSFQDFEIAFRANCLNTFDNTITGYVERRDNIKYEVNRRISAILVSYYYDMEIVNVLQDKINLYAKAGGFLGDSSITAFEVASSLGQDTTTSMTSKVMDFISKTTLQTSSSLRPAYFDYRNSIVNAYIEMLLELCVYRDYVSPAFVESRISHLALLKKPLGNVDNLSITFTESGTNSTLFGLMKQICTNISVVPLVRQEISDAIDHSFLKFGTTLMTYDVNLTKEQGTLTDLIKEMGTSMAFITNGYFAIEDTFMNENVGSFDIFFSELRMEYINQSPAYTASDALSDIGGFMGLLLGASVITVCELVDLFVYNCVRKLLYKKKSNGSTTPVTSVTALTEKQNAEKDFLNEALFAPRR